MVNYWTVPELWPGSTFVLIGGGPSLTREQVETCRGRSANGSAVRVIAINDAYRLAPWADVLYFCDDKWWQWHHEKLREWGGLIVRLQGGKHDFGDRRIKVIRNYGRQGHNKAPEGLCKLRDGVFHGQNSGFQAIGLAVHLGAKRIVLLGYDMHAPHVNGHTKTHWFGDHPGGTSPKVYEQMRQDFPLLVAPLKARGVEVLNATPGSKLDTFPRKPLAEALPEVVSA